MRAKNTKLEKYSYWIIDIKNMKISFPRYNSIRCMKFSCQVRHLNAIIRRETRMAVDSYRFVADRFRIESHTDPDLNQYISSHLIFLHHGVYRRFLMTFRVCPSVHKTDNAKPT